ncbi:MAG: replicative DNA helicase [Candidatus Magasanikbacteria bacterium]|nr:replicative DNA helicase [Candidatus Magasanikbacteria bacterium]
MTDNQIDKIPPQSLEAEMSLLGSLLIDKEAILKIADIVSMEDFYKTGHAKIYETIIELYSHNEPVDLLTLSNRLKEKNLLEGIGGKSYLVALADSVPTASNVANYAHIVHRKATRRRLLGAAHEISRLGYAEEGEMDDVLDEAQRHLFGVSQNYFKQTFTPIRGVLADAFDRIDELHKNKGQLRGLASGIIQLDQLLGGFQKSDLVVIAARPSVGKTSLALDFVRHIGTKLKVPIGMFSLEMSKEQVVDRLLCAEANIDLWRLRSGQLSDRPEADDFPRIGHAIGTLSEAPIFIDDSPNINILQLRTKARRLQAEHGLGLIVIDYLQLMESRGSQENRVQEVSEITRGLKGIARELNVPVIALSQLSRVVEQSKPAIPKLSHLRESGSIEQDADVVMFIYRKSADRNYRKEEISPDERYIAELQIAKHRNGPVGLVKVFFNEACTSFKNLDTQKHNLSNANIPQAPVKLRPKSDFVKPPDTPETPPM